jgi:hypothetical protein
VGSHYGECVRGDRWEVDGGEPENNMNGNEPLSTEKRSGIRFLIIFGVEAFHSTIAVSKFIWGDKGV